VEGAGLLVRLPAARHPFLGGRRRPFAPPFRLRVPPLALVHGVDRGRSGIPFLLLVLRLRDRCGCGGLQARSLAAEEGLQHIGQVVDEVPAVGDLGRVRGAVPRPLGVGAPRSRAMTATPGCARSQVARLSLDRSRRRSTGRCRSRSTTAGTRDASLCHGCSWLCGANERVSSRFQRGCTQRNKEAASITLFAYW
jgi:hypothetical protein